MRHLYIVTGLSGAGKNIVLRTLEDGGFRCVDNLPITLLEQFFRDQGDEKIALGLDVRSTQDNSALIVESLATLRSLGVEPRVIFVRAQAATLMKRFHETRRPHPLATILGLEAAIQREIALLEPVEQVADVVIDTDNLTLYELRKLVKKIVGARDAQKLLVMLTSFGFKHGVPVDCNFLFDVRSLPNPYHIPELRPLRGTDEAIQEYLFRHPQVVAHWEQLQAYILCALGHIQEEGRGMVHVAIGCTGGQHRSVALVERLAALPTTQFVWSVRHRDLT